MGKDYRAIGEDPSERKKLLATDLKPRIYFFTHLNDFPEEEEALLILKRVAALVKPLMLARGWKVRMLSEMYPDDECLLGLNVERGERILLRLRCPYDKTQFLPFEVVVDTMLHELSHLRHGPHSSDFNALWERLRKEVDELVLKISAKESSSAKGKSIRDAVRESARLRTQDLNSRCANDNCSDAEIRSISQKWEKKGSRTQAEDDTASDAAISQAQWEMAQELKRKFGIVPYKGPDAAGPSPSTVGSSRSTAVPPRSTVSSSRSTVVPPRSTVGSSRSTAVPSRSRGYDADFTMGPASPLSEGLWQCSVCALHNLFCSNTCNICGSARPSRSAW